MFIRDFEDCDAIIAGDRSRLRELFNPLKDDLELRYSFAVGRLEGGAASLLHRLKNSEVYYILSGRGEMQIDGETESVKPGQAIYVSPGSRQRLRNTGPRELVFVCIVDPAWRKEDEEILE